MLFRLFRTAALLGATVWALILTPVIAVALYSGTKTAIDLVPFILNRAPLPIELVAPTLFYFALAGGALFFIKLFFEPFKAQNR